MIEFALDAEKSIVTVEPREKLAASDFEQLGEAVDAHIAATGGLRGLMIHARAFPGWQDFAGLAAHLRFVREHHKLIRRVAIVADGDLLTIAPKIAAAFVSADLKHFDYDDMGAARSWLESD